MLQRLLLLGCEVVDSSVVENPPAAIHCCVPRLVDLVGETEPRLERSEESGATCTVGEVPRRVELQEEKGIILRERVVKVLRRHVAVVQHVALVIPSNAGVERQPGSRAPVILEVCSDLLVVRVVEWVSELEFQMLRNMEAVGVGPHKERVF